MYTTAAALLIGLMAGQTFPVFGQGGALPKGNYKGKDNKEAAKPAKAAGKSPKAGKTAPTQPCSREVLFPGEESGVFERDGSHLFLLARNEKQAAKPGLVRYTVYKFDVAARKAEAVYGLEQKGLVALMLLGGDPVTAVSTVSFVGPCAAALEGQAGAVSVAVAKKSDKAVQVAGDFYYFDSISGRAIADMKKNAVLEVDGQQFQTRSGARYEKGNRPIYLDSLKKNLIAWHEDSKQRGLVAYFGENGQVGTRLAIPEWDTLLRDGGYFAAATVQGKANSVVIHEIPDWTGVSVKKDHILKLPKDMPASTSLLVPRFAGSLVAVMQRSWAGRARNNDVYLFNYQTGKQLGRLNPPASTVPGFIGFTKDGKWLLIETRDQAGKFTTGLRMMATDTGLVEMAKLDPPK
jgi:hypothetical protein